MKFSKEVIILIHKYLTFRNKARLQAAPLWPELFIGSETDIWSLTSPPVCARDPVTWHSLLQVNMFGKKSKGPTSEELISNLEYKMDIVEMLMEKNEKEHSDNFTEIKDMIYSQEKKSEESFQKLEEQLETIREVLT